MRIEGEWFVCEDGVTRPTLFGRVLAGESVATDERFLVEPGADRTVLSADLLSRLGSAAAATPGNPLAGIGGMQQGLLVSAELEFEHAGGTVGIKGQYAAFNDPSATDFSVLGRDVLDLFHLILILQR